MAIDLLVIDDHQLVRKGIISLLERQSDFRVIGEAGTGLDAIQIAMQTCPDVIVLDVELDGIDGIETAKRLKQICPTAKILALSMHDEEDYVVAMLSSGTRGYILKDSALEELVNAIRAVQAGQRYLSPELVDVVLDSLGNAPSQPENPIHNLTERELEVLIHVASGKTSKEIAEELFLSIKTIDAHRQQMMKKLGIFSVAELTRFAIRHGLIKP